MLKKKITKDDILSKVDDYNIFLKYFGEELIVRDKTYRSKFRNDENPSTGFYVNKRGKLIYNDLATGEKLDCFEFVAKLYNCSYHDALSKISFDFGLTDNGEPNVELQHWDINEQEKKEHVIQIDPEPWDWKNLDFWKDYQITEKELIENEVYPIKKLIIDDEVKPNYKERLRYALVLNDIEKRYVKVYTPYDPVFKWVSTIPVCKPFGLRELPNKSDILIVTKSQKDRIIWKKYFTDVIATQNESNAALLEEDIWKLQEKYKYIYVNFDPDPAGRKGSEYYKQYGFRDISFPPELLTQGIKDVSDLVKLKGLKHFEKFLKWKKLL